MDSSATLAVLAGGYGSRMGVPKAELRIRGVPILEHLLAGWNWTGPTLLVTAPGREHPPGCGAFTEEAVDPVADLGPLRGILTALEHATTPTVAITAVDMAGVRAAQLTWLIEQFSEHVDILGLMLARDGRGEPFPSIFRIAAAEVICSRIDANDGEHLTMHAPGEPSVEPLTPADRPGTFHIPGPAQVRLRFRANGKQPSRTVEVSVRGKLVVGTRSN
jgi:molybdopterin-guanine dinucleotide biosynthesis protein A